MNVFFSVDVETSGLNPFIKRNQLLSVGALAVFEDGLIGDSWYERITSRNTWDAGTRHWWQQQSEEARREILEVKGTDRVQAARDFVAWVNDITDSAVFVANPSTFDHAWILRWLTECDQPMPFSHRTLCLRSADWGRNPGPWGGERTGHKPIVPHHALHDAQAQALDLIEMLSALREAT